MTTAAAPSRLEPVAGRQAVPQLGKPLDGKAVPAGKVIVCPREAACIRHETGPGFAWVGAHRHHAVLRPPLRGNSVDDAHPANPGASPRRDQAVKVALEKGLVLCQFLLPLSKLP